MRPAWRWCGEARRRRTREYAKITQDDCDVELHCGGRLACARNAAVYALPWASVRPSPVTRWPFAFPRRHNAAAAADTARLIWTSPPTYIHSHVTCSIRAIASPESVRRLWSAEWPNWVFRIYFSDQLGLF